jgi:hypothetical protein
MCSEVFPLGIKLPEREADHSLPSNADVKNTWTYISTPHLEYGFMSSCLCKNRDNFYLVI